MKFNLGSPRLEPTTMPK